jgi:hypothetical protein
MRRLLLAMAVVGLPATCAGGEAEDLRDRVLQAAAKDPADLKKLRTHTMKAKGVSKAGPTPTPAVHEMSGVWPGKTKMTWEFGEGGTKNGSTLCAADDRGWKAGLKMPGIDLTIEELNDFRADAYAIWMTTLLPLSDAANRLVTVPEADVGGRPAVGLKVSKRPWPDITMHFDKETLALRRMAYVTRDAGVLAAREMLFDGHKVFGGVRLPTKQTLLINKREALVWTEMEYAFPDKIDPKVFEKP